MTCLIFTCRRQGVISEMATSTPMTLHTQTQSSIGMPLHYGNSAHHHPSPHSPLKFLREDSVDGTLSPVSSKSAGTDTDTDMRKKVQLIHLFLHCIIIQKIWICIIKFLVFTFYLQLNSHCNIFISLMQRYPTDRAYFIAKEILMTERTYKKDLEIINLVSIR